MALVAKSELSASIQNGSESVGSMKTGADVTGIGVLQMLVVLLPISGGHYQ